MSFFTDKKYIYCLSHSTNDGKLRIVDEKILRKFSEMKLGQLCSLRELLENVLAWNYKTDGTLDQFFAYYSRVKSVIVRYYKEQSNAQKEDMIVLFYYQDSLEPYIKKISFEKGLYGDYTQQKAECDYNRLHNDICRIVKKEGSLKYTCDLFSLREFITQLTKTRIYRFIRYEGETLDYLEYFRVCNVYFNEVKKVTRIQNRIGVTITRGNNTIEFRDRKNNGQNSEITIKSDYTYTSQNQGAPIKDYFVPSDEEQIIRETVKIPLLPLQKKLCVWLYYKGAASYQQIQHALLFNLAADDKSKTEGVMRTIFFPLYQKGIIEVCRNENDKKILYYCTVDRTWADSDSLEVERTVETKESEIINLLKKMKSLKECIQQQKNCNPPDPPHFVWNLSKKQFVPIKSQAKGMIKCSDKVYADTYFTFDEKTVYQLPSLEENPEMLKIAKCVQRAMEKKTMFSLQNQTLKCGFYVHAIPVPILRILFRLDPKKLEKELNADFCFENLSSAIINELKHIFSADVFNA